MRLADRWTQVNQDLADELQRASGLLQLWKAYHSAHTEVTAKLEQQEAKFQQLSKINTSGNNLAETLPLALQDIQVDTKPFRKFRPKPDRTRG